MIPIRWTLFYFIISPFLNTFAFAQLTPEEELLDLLMFGSIGSATTEARDLIALEMEQNADALRALIISEVVLPQNDNLLVYADPFVSARIENLIGVINVVDSEETRTFLYDTYLTVSSHYDSLIDMYKMAEAEGQSQEDLIEFVSARGGAAGIHNGIISAFRGIGDDRILEDALSRMNRLGVISKLRIMDYHETITSITTYKKHLSLSDGWNMISLPVEPIGTSFHDDLFNDVPLSTEPATWEDPTYIFEEYLSVGKGYWVKSATEAYYQDIVGVPDTLITLNLAEGWNLIGGPHCGIGYLHEYQIIDTDGVLVFGNMYGYEDGYVVETTLYSGKGYWIKTTGSGEIIMNCVAHQASKRGPAPPPQIPDDFRIISIQDAAGSSQKLYFGSTLPANWSQSYTLPPPPPTDNFDARFSDDTRLLETAAAEIKIQSGNYPITIILPGNSGEQQFVVEEIISGQVFSSLTIQSGSSFEINDAQVTSIRIRPR